MSLDLSVHGYMNLVGTLILEEVRDGRLFFASVSIIAYDYA